MYWDAVLSGRDRIVKIGRLKLPLRTIEVADKNRGAVSGSKRRSSQFRQGSLES